MADLITAWYAATTDWNRRDLTETNVVTTYGHDNEEGTELHYHQHNNTSESLEMLTGRTNLLKTKRTLLYLKTQSVPRCKHFSSRL